MSTRTSTRRAPQSSASKKSVVGSRSWRVLLTTILASAVFLDNSSVPVGVHAAKTQSNNKNRGNDRSIQIINSSNIYVILVSWINPTTHETVPMSDPLYAGTDLTINSYVGHEFEVKELPGKTGACQEATCRTTTFVVSSNDEQTVTVTPEFEAVLVDTKVKAQKEATDIMAECQSAAQQRVAAAGDDAAAAMAAMQELVDCVEVGVADRLEKINEEIAFQASIRTSIAAQLENYTCDDDTLNSTADIDTHTWVHQDGQHRTVHVKHERPSSKIHVIEHFISDDECVAMEQAAAKTLHHATVADGKGGSRLSENRKAMQAGITVPWDEEASDHPIARISRRVYDYTNHVLGLDIREHGQEDLMSIQYFGRGINDTSPDRYTPHCDGDCTGLPHKHGTRMATMVLYCDMATKGGHTNFRNAGVHIKPEKHYGIFFSYMDPHSGLMDTGFTEHSGCPVYEGHKKIVTQWIRLGVDADNTWDSFNTLGIKKSEMLEAMHATNGAAAAPPDDADEDAMSPDDRDEL